MNTASQLIEFKPQKSAFYFSKLKIIGIILLFSLLSLPFAPYIFLGILFIFGVSVFLISFQYNKERYQILPSRIIKHSGGIFSDKTIELPVKKITHLKSKKPFLLSLFFKSEHLYIESAGGSSTEIIFFSVPQESDFEAKIIQVMRQNGFRLQHNQLDYEEKPSTLAVILEVLKKIGGGMIFFLLFVGNILAEGDSEAIIFIILPLAIIGLLGLIISPIFNYLDLKRRVYRIYEDSIIYYEGFLTKHRVIIPGEMLTDTNLNQTFWDKVFDLYDVRISCKGTGKEISFKNIKEGKTLSQKIRALMEKELEIQETIPQKKNQKETEPISNSVQNQGSVPMLEKDESYTRKFKMHKGRALSPLLIFAPLGILTFYIPEIFGIFFFVFFAGVKILIDAFSYTYEVNKKSLQSTYSFLNTKTIEFSNSKVTAIIFKQNPLDWIFNTEQITFWSIGSGSALHFRYIKKEEGFHEKLLMKFGIKPEMIQGEIHTNFSFMNMIKAHIFKHLFFWLLILSPLSIYFIDFPEPIISTVFLWLDGLFLILYASSFIYAKFFYTRQKGIFHPHYIFVRQGLFIVKKYYALYDNIKNATFLRYPFSDTGITELDIAGEGLSATTGKGIQARVAYRLFLPFTSRIQDYKKNFDKFLLNVKTSDDKTNLEHFLNIETANKRLFKDKPNVANTLSGVIPILLLVTSPSLLFLSNLFIPLMVLGGIILVVIWVIVWIKAQSIILENDRIIKKSGIIYKKQTSILLQRIDHSEISQSMSNKIFKNGNLKIYTLGSGKAEIVLHNLSKYRELYKLINQE